MSMYRPGAYTTLRQLLEKRTGRVTPATEPSAPNSMDGLIVESGHHVRAQVRPVVGGSQGLTAVTLTWRYPERGALFINLPAGLAPDSVVDQANEEFQGECVVQSGTGTHYFNGGTTIDFLYKVPWPAQWRGSLLRAFGRQKPQIGRQDFFGDFLGASNECQ